MKKVLITGANSYIGVSFEKYVATYYSGQLSINTVDMRNGNWRKINFSGYDIVYHVAGIAHVDVGNVSDEVKSKYYAINTDLAIEAAKKAKKENVKQFVFMSSAIVYGDSAPYGKSKRITKYSKPKPTNFYGDSKWRAEKGIIELVDGNFTVAILRPPMIYGRGCRGNYPILAKIAKKTPIFPDIENERSMLYIENLCEFLCQIMIRGEGGVFWPQNSEYTRTSRMVRMIAEVSGDRIYVSKVWNWIPRIAVMLPGKPKILANKAFGNLTYDQGLSCYSFNYQIFSLEESIKRTEGQMEEAPLVSVIMATYNDKPAYIHEAIDSIINQTYKNIELLIMDDSTDEGTKAAIDSYSFDSRVHIYRDNYKLGFVASLNKGLSISKGEYIARMDGDDVAMLDRLKKQVDYLRNHPTTDILGGQINVINEKSEITGARTYPLGGIKLLLFFTLRTPVAHPAVMFRRKIVDANHRYDETLPKAEDIDFWIRLYNAGYKFNNLPDTIVNFRVDTGFMKKRVTNHEQENYVLKARRDNFTWGKPFFSTADFIMSYVRQWTPDSIKAKKYEQENGKMN